MAIGKKVQFFEKPQLSNPRMLLGFSGWMDGGEVSTGTVRCLVDKLGAKKFADIDPEDFYIYNIPGSMETAALFRPHTRVEGGVVASFELPANEFFWDQANNLVLFLGKEPNLRWRDFAGCLFHVCETVGVSRIYFIGSVGGLVPHTRQPRLLYCVSNPGLGENLQHYGIKATEYEGPASFSTFLSVEAARRGLEMITLIATIPAYVQGANPKCIEAVTRRLAGMLSLRVDLDDISAAGDEFERKLNEIIAQQPELAGNIAKLEEDYDNEIFDNEMGDLKKWLEQKGIRLD